MLASAGCRAAQQRTGAQFSESSDVRSDDGALAPEWTAQVGQRDTQSTALEYALFRSCQWHGGAEPICKSKAEAWQLAVPEDAPQTLPNDCQIGDVLRFSWAADNGSQLAGVVIAKSDDGTVTFLALVRGVVRKAVMNLSVPHKKRDESGRVLNTHLGWANGPHKAGQKFLAGELFLAAYDGASLWK